MITDPGIGDHLVSGTGDHFHWIAHVSAVAVPERQTLKTTVLEIPEERSTVNCRSRVPESPSLASAGALMDRVCACAPTAKPKNSGRQSRRAPATRRKLPARQDLPARARRTVEGSKLSEEEAGRRVSERRPAEAEASGGEAEWLRRQCSAYARELSDRRPATGDRRPATGDRRPATGDRRLYRYCPKPRPRRSSPHVKGPPGPRPQRR